MTNVQYSDAIHIFYNPETNCILSIQFKRMTGMFEIKRSDETYTQFMSLNRIIEKRDDEVWDFLGVL